MTDLLLDTPWIGMAAWTFLYVSDYYWTLTNARMYQAGVNKVFIIEGSYELTPYFQKDIDALRYFSPRFMLALFLTNCALAIGWWLSRDDLGWRNLYLWSLGVLILLSLTVHQRHIRNFFLFRAMLRPEDGIQGRIAYPRPVILRQSAIEFLCFAGLFLSTMLVTPNWFTFGGVVGCLVTAVKHWQLARKHSQKRLPSVSDERAGNNPPTGA